MRKAYFWVSVHHMMLELHGLATMYNWLQSLVLFVGADGAFNCTLHT